jgi:hypothetical protein
VAVRAWRKVQVLRPSSSTSGGQSDCEGVVVDACAVAGGGGFEVVDGEEVWAFVIAAQDAKEVQERQLQPIEVSGGNEA